MFHQSWKNLHPPHLASGKPSGILVNHFEKNVRCFITFVDFDAIYILFGKTVLQICDPFIVLYCRKVTIYPLLAFKKCTLNESFIISDCLFLFLLFFHKYKLSNQKMFYIHLFYTVMQLAVHGATS